MELKYNLDNLYEVLDKSLKLLVDGEKNLKLEEKVSKNFFQKFFRMSGSKSKSTEYDMDYNQLINLLNDIYSMKDKRLVLDEKLLESLEGVYKYLDDEGKVILKEHLNEAINNTSKTLVSEFKDKCNEFFDKLSKFNLSNKFVYDNDEVIGTYVSVFNKLRNNMLDNIFNFSIENYLNVSKSLEEEIEELKKIYIEKERLTKVVTSITNCVSNLKVNTDVDFSKSVTFLEELKNKNIILLEEKEEILEESSIEKIEKAIEAMLIEEVDMDFYYDLAYRLFKLKVSGEKELEEISKLEFEMMEYANKYNLGNVEKIDASLVALERYSNEMKGKENLVIDKNKGLSIYQDLVYKLYKLKKNDPSDFVKINKLEDKIKFCKNKYQLSDIELIDANLVALERFGYVSSRDNKNKGLSIYESLISRLYSLRKEEDVNSDEINDIEGKIIKCSNEYKLSNIEKINMQFKILENNL